MIDLIGVCSWWAPGHHDGSFSLFLCYAVQTKWGRCRSECMISRTVFIWCTYGGVQLKVNFDRMTSTYVCMSASQPGQHWHEEPFRIHQQRDQKHDWYRSTKNWLIDLCRKSINHIASSRCSWPTYILHASTRTMVHGTPMVLVHWMTRLKQLLSSRHHLH